MSVLDQCFEIINLTSPDWPEEERYALVGHSFRVMAKAKNYDELVVGLMHAFYAASSTTRYRFYREMIRGDYEWRTALELFVHPLPERRFKARETVSDEYLLSLNMPVSFQMRKGMTGCLNRRPLHPYMEITSGK
jgi:hypothetical protein